MSEMSPGPDWYGRASITPGNDVVAGSFGRWRLIYTIGHHGVDDLGTILVTRRLASDWGRPQFDTPSAANYTTVTTNGQARLRAWFDPTAYIRPWKAAIVIRVYDGALAPGDQVVVDFGDGIGGSPGAQAQRFREETFEFRIAVDSFGTGQFIELPNSPTLRVIGGAPVRLRLMAPSQAGLEQPFAITVKAEDRWGNPADGYSAQLEIAAPALTPMAAPISLSTAARGSLRVEGLRLTQPGIHRLCVSDPATGLIAESNPIVVGASPDYPLFWGDIHGQTEMAVGTGSVEEYFAYGRDVAGLDFIAHCANDFQITSAAYAETVEAVRHFHQPGRYVPFLAYEWSGNTPSGGDHNVYYLADDQPIHRSSHWQIADRSDEATDRYPIDRLHTTMADRQDVLILPHIGGRRANLDFHRADFGPVIEIQSVHGLFWWFAEEALRRGLRVGFIAGSDDHTGRPGSTLPTSADIHFGMRGGLIAAYAERLDRESLWEAIRARRVYGTTGERIIVNLTADGRPMGAEYATHRAPRLAMTVIGTAPLERVELYRGLDCLYRPALAPIEPGRRLQIVWSGARVRGRNREAVWDGGLTLAGGQIRAAHEFAFDGPEEGITERSPHHLRWRSSTCGDPDGLLLDVDLSPTAVLHFDTPLCRFELALSQLGPTPQIVTVGGVDCQVEIGWAPVDASPNHLQVEYVDEAIQPGLNAYYLRIRQHDGGLAWSSPIYVTYSVPPGALT